MTPTLSLVEKPDPKLEEKQGGEAWTHVLDGYGRALAELPPGHPERPFLLGLRKAGGMDVRLSTASPDARPCPAGDDSQAPRRAWDHVVRGHELALGELADDHAERDEFLNMVRLAKTVRAEHLAEDRRPALVREYEEIRKWWNHIGAIGGVNPCLYTLGHHARGGLRDAGLVWIDAIDAMSDRELRAIPGIGRKSAAEIREALDVYFWRGDRDLSRAMWARLRADLRAHLEHRYLGERDRVLDGIEFARRVLDEEGAPLADRAAARKAVRS